MDQLFIAPKVKVGFQNRNDTFTGMLAYVIYYDLHGVLRKETSWQRWRDKKIEPVEFDNVPTEGFVLNKKVGGVGYSHWNHRQEYVRVYDPRNFEFEITVPNLLFILSQCDCSRGKGLEGKFVYAWSGSTLVLLPVSSEEYKKSAGYTSLQVKTIAAKELVKGASYLTKKQEKWVYLDRRAKHNVTHSSSWGPGSPVELMYVFWDERNEAFVFQKDLKKLAAVISDVAVPDYAELVEKYDKSIYGSPPVRLFTKKEPKRKVKADQYWRRHEWAIETSPGVFTQYSTSYHVDGTISYIQRCYEFSLQENEIPAYKGTKHVRAEDRHAHAYPPSSRRHYGSGSDYMPWIDPVDLGLWAELASGAQFKISGTYLIEPGENDGED